MTQTTPCLHDPYTFGTHENLVRCLEQYCTIEGRPKVTKVGEGSGDDEPTGNRYDAILRQNGAIDRAMSQLKDWHLPSYQILDSYYRRGLHEEATGWERSLLRAQLPHHPQTHRERMLLEVMWERLLSEATASLLRAHKGRPERTI